MDEKLKNKTLGIIHAAVFTANKIEPFCREIIPEVSVMHFGDDTVQRDNLNAPVGTIPKVNFFKFTTYCHFLEEAGVDLIMLACSTFNAAVPNARPMINVPLLNIDRPMMDLAVAQGRRVGLIGTLPSTMPSSQRILQEAARDAGKEVQIESVLCSEAFKVLRAGDAKRHNEMLLDEIDVLSRRVDAIVLAQLSMSVLENDVKGCAVPVFNSGRTGLERARKMLLEM